MAVLERKPVVRKELPFEPGTDPCNENPAATPSGLASRIRRLIEIEGSAATIAERCGFSAGAVRSWRDGHSDISRERCVTIARNLRVSLLWLVAGEGPMRTERSEPDGSASIMPVPAAGAQASNLDPRLLAAALRLLQSYIGLIGGSLDPATRAGLLAELYSILAHADETGRADRLIAFHGVLSDRLRRHRALVS